MFQLSQSLRGMFESFGLDGGLLEFLFEERVSAFEGQSYVCGAGEEVRVIGGGFRGRV